jgi:hypothetical protein
MRFMGLVNILDKKDDGKSEDPTKAEGTPPQISGPTSAA